MNFSLYSGALINSVKVFTTACSLLFFSPRIHEKEINAQNVTLRGKSFIALDQPAQVNIGSYNFKNADKHENRTGFDSSSPSDFPAFDYIFDIPIDYSPHLEFTHSFSPAGDLNGDGYDDFILLQGLLNYDHYEFFHFAYVYYGSPSGLSYDPSWKLELKGPNAFQNYMAFPIGDVNGDGFDDVCFTNHISREVFIHFGSDSGLAKNESWQIKDTSDNDQYLLVQPLGDINNDGFDDIVRFSQNHNAFIYYGAADGPGKSPDSIILENEREAFYGYTVNTAGDVNGDGYGDIIVYFGRGNAYLYFGSSSGFNHHPQQIGKHIDESSTGVVRSVASGDFNGDGFADFLIEEREPYFINNVQTDSTLLRIFTLFGSASGLNTEPNYLVNKLIFLFTDAIFDVRSLGDINGDHYTDISLSEAIGSIVYYGSANGLVPVPDDQYRGFEISKGGNVNGDARDDIFGENLYHKGILYYGTSDEPSRIVVPKAIFRCFDSSNNYQIPQPEISGKIYQLRFSITGATQRSGLGRNVGTQFNPGESVVNWFLQGSDGEIKRASTLITIDRPIDIAIKDAINPNGKPNTIYLGYGATGLRLVANPHGGTKPYSLKWSTNDTLRSIVVKPDAAGSHTYTVTITDGKGCTAVAEKTIVVEDIRCPFPIADFIAAIFPQLLDEPAVKSWIRDNTKLSVCSSGSTQCVNRNNVASLLQSGSTLGPCSMGTIPPEAFRSDEITDKVNSNFEVIVSPNPSPNNFRLNVLSISNKPVTIRIVDLMGRQVELISKASTNKPIQVGDRLKAGTYIAEIISGNDRKTVKLIKVK